ncbi:hypothetical protein ABPG72_016420 [Tetrahymena utriculariae]
MNQTRYASLRNNNQRQPIQIEIITNKLYWVSSLIVNNRDDSSYSICTDYDYVYSPFFKDFGPIQLGLIHKFIMTLDKLLCDPNLSNLKIVHNTTLDLTKKTSSAFLMGCYMVIKLNVSPEDAWYKFQSAGQFRPYRDPANNTCYEQRLIDCWKGLKKANSLGWYNPDTFDIKYYNYHSKPENGNFNIIAPSKFVAFNGPYFTRIDLRGYRRNIVEDYIEPFRSLGVTTIIRLNNKEYDEKKFTSKGFRHLDFFFPDGTAPRKDLVQKFLNQIETIERVIAVHCHAGLGRTATMIGAYVIKHYKFTADEFIAWVRICRPGSMHGPQQLFLKEIELDLLNERTLTGGNAFNVVPKNIYTSKNQNQIRSNSLTNVGVQNQQKKPSPLQQNRNLSLPQGQSQSPSSSNNENIVFSDQKMLDPSIEQEIQNQEKQENKKDIYFTPQKTQKSLANFNNIFNKTTYNFVQQKQTHAFNLPQISSHRQDPFNKSLLTNNNIKNRNNMYKINNPYQKVKENNFFSDKQSNQSPIQKVINKTNIV